MSSRSSASVSNSVAATRERVVDLGEHLLLDLLDGDRDGLLRAVRDLEVDLLRLPGVQPRDAGFDLLDDGAAAELDDVVAPGLAVRRDEVDDHGVVGADGPALDGDELGDGRAEGVELLLHELLGNLGLDGADLERRPVRHLGLRLDGDGRGELPVLVVARRKLEVVLGLLDRADAGAGGGVPEPAGDVAVDRLGHQAVLADALEQDLPRDLPLAEPGDLDARGEIGRRVLDRMVHVV